MKNSKIPIKDICIISLFTAIVAILSWISIPMPLGVPLTLQTFAIPLAGIILGSRKGTISIIVYVLIGAVGVPVFAGFSGGFAAIFGMSGGYIWAFPLMALCAGLGAKKGGVPWLVLGLIAGIVIDYTVGTLQFMLITGSDFKTSIWGCVIPFMPTEAIKATLAGVLGIKCRNILVKNGVVTV